MSSSSHDLAATRRALAQAQAQLEAERAARARAERMNAMKDGFLSLVAHELRSPLGAILGWAHMLRRRGGQEEFDKGLDVIEHSVHAQARLIEDLLEFARMTSGRIELDLHPVEPRSFIDAAVAAIVPDAQAKEISVRKVLDLTVGPVCGDANRLQQVMLRLLSNAVKFTPEGGAIEVALRAGEGRAEISVSDTGAGIAPALLPHIFDRFGPPEGQPRPPRGGLGLGLVLARHLVELHGGRISADSPGEGRGATFTVSLPLAAEPAPA